MKKLSFIVMLACLGFFAASCSDDDKPDPAPEKDYAKEIASPYLGDLGVTLPGSPALPSKNIVIVEKAGENKINLTLKDFAFSTILIGDIKLTDIVIEGNKDGVIIKEKTFNDYKLNVLGNEENVTIVIKGTAANNKLALNLDILGAMGIKEAIKVTYDGEKNTQSSDALITSVTTDHASVEAETLKVDGETKTISFAIKEDAVLADLKEVTLAFELSEKVTTTPELKDKKATFDLTSGASKIEVVSENGLKKTTYTIKVNYVESTNAEVVSAKTTNTLVKEVKVNAEEKLISVNLKEGAKLTDLKEVELQFELSKKAASMPALTEGVAKFDLTSGSSEIEVIAEDGIEKNTYKIVANTFKHTFLYNMEEWVVEVKSQEEGLEPLYAPAGGWGTTNSGTVLINAFGLIDTRTNVEKTSDANSGKSAVKLITLDSQGKVMGGFFPDIPKITSASLFLGEFKVDIKNTLNSTKFGIPFDHKPITLKGYYKYTPGKEFYRSTFDNSTEAKVEEGTIDKCAINAFLYEIKDDKDDYITGVDTYKDPRIVAHASFESAGADKYTEFNKEFVYKEGKTYDKSKKYRIAIVASSSSQGDTFSGAPGSTLYLDDIEIIAE